MRLAWITQLTQLDFSCKVLWQLFFDLNLAHQGSLAEGSINWTGEGRERVHP